MKCVSVSMAAVVVMSLNLIATASEGPSAPANVRVTIEVARQDGANPGLKQKYELISPVNGHSSIMLGRRVPIPIQTSTAPQSEAPESASVTKYSYQDVGFTAKIETELEDENRLRISGLLDISSVLEEQADEDPGTLPVLEAVQQRFNVVVEDGASVHLLSVADSVSNGLAISLQATFID